MDILTTARTQVLEQGIGLDEAQALACLQLPDDRVDDLLDLAHEVRMKWCGDEVEVEGIGRLRNRIIQSERELDDVGALAAAFASSRPFIAEKN